MAELGGVDGVGGSGGSSSSTAGGAGASMVVVMGDTEAEADSLSHEPGISPPAATTNYDSSDGQIPIHRCEICHNYEAFSKQALLTHTANCSAQNNDQNSRKLFECDICQMKFSNGANMRRHKMRHTGVKPYECRVCQKRFFRKDHLAEHFTTHTKTLPYHCPICNRGFQRQIAMRAHFQNEHVGQHDMIKSCPLCSYRAGTMKALRVHFFNRHGIDLDNPGPTITAPGGIPNNDGGNQGAYSDSGDSLGARSIDNATPPMHFLTPHVEISMADTPIQCDEPAVAATAGSGNELLMNGDSPNGSPRSGDSNAPSSSQQPSASSGTGSNGGNGISENETPQPCIKQEPESENNTSLIKISPLKSLLRDDLKRKLSITTLPRRGSGSGGGNSGSGSATSAAAAAAHAASVVASAATPPPTSLLSAASGEEWSSLRCVYCGISFPDQTLYFLHKGCHSDSNPWKCNICGEQCSNVYEFNSHLLSKTHQ